MDWITNLFFGTGIAHSIFVMTLAIALGLFLSEKLKIKGITLGITWILFSAIAFSHFGMHLDLAGAGQFDFHGVFHRDYLAFRVSVTHICQCGVECGGLS